VSPVELRDEPVRFFKELYPVVVGVAMALAVERLVDLNKPGVPIRWQHVPLFVSWLAVTLPFSHLAVRHLDFAYGERRQAGEPIRRGATLENIALGAGQFMWIIALALFVTRPMVFGYGLVIFLGGILIRNAVLHLHPRGWLSQLERRASRVHVAAVAAWLAIMLLATFALDGSPQTWTIRGGILAVSVAYPFVLYLTSYDYFFGTR